MKYQLLLILSLIALLASATLAVNEQNGGVCSADGQSSCSIVSNSSYSHFLFGISNSYIGVVALASLSILIFSFLRRPNKLKKLAIHFGIMFAGIIALYFIYIQEFILKTYCPYCMAVDISMIFSLGIILFWKRKKYAY